MLWKMRAKLLHSTHRPCQDICILSELFELPGQPLLTMFIEEFSSINYAYCNRERFAKFKMDKSKCEDRVG